MVDCKFYIRTPVKSLGQLLEIETIAQLVLPDYQFSEKVLNLEIQDLDVLKEASWGQITFFDNPKYKQDFFDSKAQFCITRPDFIDKAPKNMIVIPSHDPYRLYAVVAEALYKTNHQKMALSDAYYQDPFGAMIHKEAHIEEGVQTSFGVVIHEGAHIGAFTKISANTVVGAGCHIGRYCEIESHVSIAYSLIGDYVHILTGAKIGQDGFGFAMGKTHQKVPQLGRVIIQDHVSLGANTCVDRGTIQDTIIGQGTRIDNMVQIAHNVTTGVNCVIAGNSSIAGSVTLGHYVICGGHTCIAGHLNIHDQARISGGAAVIRDVEAQQTVAGNPAFGIKSYFKSIAILKKLAKSRS